METVSSGTEAGGHGEMLDGWPPFGESGVVALAVLFASCSSGYDANVIDLALPIASANIPRSRICPSSVLELCGARGRLSSDYGHPKQLPDTATADRIHRLSLFAGEGFAKFVKVLYGPIDSKLSR